MATAVTAHCLRFAAVQAVLSCWRPLHSSLTSQVLALLLLFLSPGGEVGVQVGSGEQAGELVNTGGNGEQ